LKQHGGDGEIPGGDDADPVIEGGPADLGEILVGQSRRPDDDVDAPPDGRQHVGPHGVGPRVIDQHVGRRFERLGDRPADLQIGAPVAIRVAQAPPPLAARDGADEAQIVRARDGGREGLADPPGGSRDTDFQFHRLPPAAALARRLTAATFPV
jgi:hypothetical protein